MTTETMTEEASTTGSGATGVPTLLAAGDATLPPMFADAGPVSDPAAETALVPTVDPPPDPDSWRAEVAARLEHYRTRRKPRTPRYPSLLLPFDAPESWSRPAPPPERARMASTGPAFGGPGFATVAIVRTEHDPAFEADLDDVRSSPQGAAQQDFCPAEPAKVIEFPRSAAIPVFRASELADPVFDRPRIVEAPEIFLPPPALGGMLIEPIPAESAERNADAATPSSSASIGRRLLAALVDGSVLAASVAAFVTIFLRLNPSLTPSLNDHGGLLAELGGLAVVAVVFSATYEFLFVVYTGSTPGLRAARLRLESFDGASLNRRARRWRVLASYVSAFSAGLGYLWCLLDQDRFCWHDRITRTHVRAVSKAE